MMMVALMVLVAVVVVVVSVLRRFTRMKQGSVFFLNLARGGLSLRVSLYYEKERKGDDEAHIALRPTR